MPSTVTSSTMDGMGLQYNERVAVVGSYELRVLRRSVTPESVIVRHPGSIKAAHLEDALVVKGSGNLACNTSNPGIAGCLAYSETLSREKYLYPSPPLPLSHPRP